MKKLLSILVAVMVLGLTPLAQAADFYNIATGPTGGTYYPVGAAMAKIWTDNIDGVKASAQSTGGTVNNIQLLSSGDAELCFADGLYFDAFHGNAKYKGTPQDFLRGMVALYPEVIHIVVAKDSGIKSFADLKGKRVSVGAVGGSVTITAQNLFAAAGMDMEKDIVVEHLGHADANAAFADKRIDAAINVGTIGISSVTEPTTIGTVYLIDIDPEIVAKMCASTPYFTPFTIAAGTYKGQDKDITTFSSPNIIAVKESVNADVVYAMTKSLFEHKADLVAVKATMNAMAPEAVSQIKIPLHPGAEKYYKELGLIQ